MTIREQSRMTSRSSQMSARFALTAMLLALAAPPVAAQEPEAAGRNVMVGTGVQLIPSFPGADSTRVTFLPLVDTWRVGEAMTPESPDEAFGFAVLGKRGKGISAGPAFTFAPGRSADDLPGLPKVGTAVELGLFADTWPVKPVRLRAELRQGIGGHKALTGDLAADLVLREGKEGPIATVGPRLRWGSAKYNRAYFGVPTPGTGGFAPYEPGAGLYAVGASVGLRLPVTRIFGLYAYAGYDRLVGNAQESPIVRAGQADQFSGGLALTYRFRL